MIRAYKASDGRCDSCGKYCEKDDAGIFIEIANYDNDYGCEIKHLIFLCSACATLMSIGMEKVVETFYDSPEQFAIAKRVAQKILEGNEKEAANNHAE